MPWSSPWHPPETEREQQDRTARGRPAVRAPNRLQLRPAPRRDDVCAHQPARFRAMCAQTCGAGREGSAPHTAAASRLCGDTHTGRSGKDVPHRRASCDTWAHAHMAPMLVADMPLPRCRGQSLRGPRGEVLFLSTTDFASQRGGTSSCTRFQRGDPRFRGVALMSEPWLCAIQAHLRNCPRCAIRLVVEPCRPCPPCKRQATCAS